MSPTLPSTSICEAVPISRLELSIGRDTAAAKAVDRGDSAKVAVQESFGVVELVEVVVEISVRVAVGASLYVADASDWAGIDKEEEVGLIRSSTPIAEGEVTTSLEGAWAGLTSADAEASMSLEGDAVIWSEVDDATEVSISAELSLVCALLIESDQFHPDQIASFVPYLGPWILAEVLVGSWWTFSFFFAFFSGAFWFFLSAFIKGSMGNLSSTCRNSSLFLAMFVSREHSYSDLPPFFGSSLSMWASSSMALLPFPSVGSSFPSPSSGVLDLRARLLSRRASGAGKSLVWL